MGNLKNVSCLIYIQSFTICAMDLLPITILDTFYIFITIWSISEMLMTNSGTSMPIFCAFSNTNIRQIKIPKSRLTSLLQTCVQLTGNFDPQKVVLVHNLSHEKLPAGKKAKFSDFSFLIISTSKF